MFHTEDVWDNHTQHALKIPDVFAAPTDQPLTAGTITESNEELKKSYMKWELFFTFWAQSAIKGNVYKFS